MHDLDDLHNSLPWAELAAPVARAEDALARLDERLRTSPIRDGWIARTHFVDAAAALALYGELVDLEDLTLHDAGMDLRAPTHELIRAHAVLRTRRRIAAAVPGWALSTAGLDVLRGRAGERESPDVENSDPVDADDEPFDAPADDDAELSALLAAVDAANARVDASLAGETPAAGSVGERNPLVYDRDWDEDARLAEWRAAVARTRDLPPTLAAAIVSLAWSAIEPLQHAPGLGRLLAADLLRSLGKTGVHLACLAQGAKATPHERRRARDPAVRLTAEIEAIAAAAAHGLEQHDRWLLARAILLRKLDERRSTSRLPELIEFVISRPLVSAEMICNALGITPRGAQNLVAELNLREATGRRRYRAWGVV